jgi:hypothetical protein
MDWGNVVVTAVERVANQVGNHLFSLLYCRICFIINTRIAHFFSTHQCIGATVRLNLEDKDYKKTKKFTWLSEAAEEKSVPVVAVDFEPLINKAHVAKVFKLFFSSLFMCKIFAPILTPIG